MTSGEKIKKIRQLRGWTQAALASMLGLPVTRIAQYEGNIRNPKFSQLEDFASALGVPVEFLKSHETETYCDVEHTLLELESTYGLEIDEENGKFTISFKDSELTEFLRRWSDARKGSKQNAEAKQSYEIWKAEYPISYAKECEKKIKEQQKKNKKSE